MANNRHRRVARLRTPEEREQYVLERMSNIFGKEVTSVEEAEDTMSSFIKRVVDKIKVVIR